MKHILVIDDNDDLRSMISAVLTRSGFSTLEAGDAQTAAQLIQADKPDLIISDVRMPGMDGYALLTAIRNRAETAPIPFILMTGSGSRGDFRRGMVCGADDYLFKPFTAEELLEAVLSRLSRHTDLQMDAMQHAKEVSDRAALKFSREVSRPIDGIIEVVNTMMRKAEELSPEEVFADARRINESVLELDHLARGIAH